MSRTSTVRPAPISRNAAIAALVVLLHLGGLWALQSGLLRRAVEIVVPAQMLSEFVEPPMPKVEPPPPLAPPPPRQIKQPLAKAVTKPVPAAIATPAPVPVAIAEATPAPTAPAAPAGTSAPQAPTPPVTAPAVVAEASAPLAPPAPVKVELPSSEAEYLHNPDPVYPPVSKRQGEQGKVVYKVSVGADGLPKSADLVKSSGFERLDQAAYKAVMGWRYAPGKRNGVPTAMSYEQVVTFVLK